MLLCNLKKVFDEAVIDAIKQMPTVSMGFKGNDLDLRTHIDNEVDFYLGMMVAIINEKYIIYALKSGFTKEEIISTNSIVLINIFNMIPKLKEEIKRIFNHDFAFI